MCAALGLLTVFDPDWSGLTVADPSSRRRGQASPDTPALDPRSVACLQMRMAATLF